MGNEDSRIREEARIDLGPLPQSWRMPVADFLSRFEHDFGLVCAILFGSIATGTYVPGSDIDLVLIADASRLPADFLERLKAVADLYKPGAPIEALAYTPAEFIQMITDLHVTALDATTQGVVLYGQRAFEEFKAHTNALIKCGLRRRKDVWAMDRKAHT